MQIKNQSKVRQKILSLMFGLSLLFNIFAPFTTVLAETVTPPTAPVMSWQLMDAENQVVSETNPIKAGEDYTLSAEVHLQALTGAKLVAGSVYQVNLPINAEVGTWSGEQTTPKALVNKLGETIGTFVVQNQVILLTLNEAVVDLEQVDAIIQTDAVLTTNVDQNVTQAVQVGDIAQTLTFKAVTVEPISETPIVKPALRAATAAVDYSSQVVVKDWDLLDSAGNPLSTTNTGINNGTYQLKFTWALSPSGATLNEGDTFSFNVPTMTPSGTWNATNYAWSNFSDANGTVLGQWRINNNKIEVVLGANVTGKQSISAEFTSGATAYTALVGAQGGTFNVSFGGIVKPITFIPTSMGVLGSNDAKLLSSSSNTSSTWAIMVGRTEVKGLGKSIGTAYDNQTGVYVEDSLKGTPTTLTLETKVYIPSDLTSGVLSPHSAITLSIPVTRVTQTPGESYEDFKSRLGIYQYGFYQDAFGQYTSVLCLGNMGSDGVRYSDLNSNFASVAATNAINAGYYSESDRAALETFFTNTYGNGNVIGGRAAIYTAYISENYPQVATTTSINNTARITKNGIAKDWSASGQLQVPSGSGASVSAGSAGIYLADTDTNFPLAGTFKLQQKQSDGSWTDYGTTTWTTDTANMGFVNAGPVVNGTYRFVEVTAPNSEYDLPHSPGYDTSVSTVVSSEFAVASTDTVGQVVTVKNTKYKFNVTYTKGTQGDFTDNIFSGRIINSMTPSFSGTVDTNGDPIGKAGYTFTGWSPAVANTVTATVTYTAQWAPITYDINYVLDGGSNDASNPANYTYGVGVTNFEPAVKDGYTFLGWFDAATGGNEITAISDTTTGNQTLYAQWRPNVYNINYVLDGGSNDASNPDDYTYGVGVANFEPAVKDGYTFLGWFDAATGGNEITAISGTTTGNQTLYAQWRPNVYNITYVLDGGSNDASNPANYTYGVGVANFEPAVKDGYTFLGWFDAATDGNEITAISDTTTGNQTLYAQWRPNVYNITYVLDGGSNDASNPDDYTYGVGVANFEPAVKDGYTFLGWFDAATDGNEITAISDTTTGNQMLYAHYVIQAILKNSAAPITIYYVDQSGKTLKTSLVLTGNLGDTIESLAPNIAGYELISSSNQVKTVITDQAQTFTFVYKPATSGFAEPINPTSPSHPNQPVQPEKDRLAQTNDTLPYAGENQDRLFLLIGIALVALFSLLSWVKLSKRYARNSE